MKEKYLSLPEPLRRQVLFRFSMSLLSLCLLPVAIITGSDWRFCIPFTALAIFFAANGMILIRGKYIVIEGTCTEVEKTSICKRVKALTLRSEPHTIKLQVGRQRIKSLAVGDTVIVYISPNTAVYDVDGLKQINTYLAIERKGRIS